MGPGSAMRAARLGRGLTQQDVSQKAGVTQAHLSQIERGLDAHYSVLLRVAEALGLTIEVRPRGDEAPYEDEIENRRFLLGQLAAQRLSAERLSVFRAWLEAAITRLGDYPYFREWLAIVDRGPSAVAATLADSGEFGRYMRSVATLLPFITREERDAVYRA